MLKTEVKRQLLVLLVIFIFLFIGAIFLIDKGNFNITGFAITDSYNYPVNKLFSQNSYVDLQLMTAPTSISISGAVQGLGTIKVYANDGESRSLIFDKQVLNLPTQLSEDELLDLQQFSSTCLDSCSHMFASNNIRLEIEVQDASLYIEDVTYSETPQQPLAPTPEPIVEEFEVQTEEPQPVQQPVVQETVQVEVQYADANKLLKEQEASIQSNERFLFGNGRLVDKEAKDNIAIRTKDDPEFHVIFEDLVRTATDVTVTFHHDSETDQPIAVIGDVQYTLSTNDAVPGESVTLNIPLVDFEVPNFTLRVGASSEEFDFGDGGFQAQDWAGCGGTSSAFAGEIMNHLSGFDDCTLAPNDIVTVTHDNVNVFINTIIGNSGFVVVNVVNANNVIIIGPGDLSNTGSGKVIVSSGTSTSLIVDNIDVTSVNGNAFEAVNGGNQYKDGTATTTGTGVPVSYPTSGASGNVVDGGGTGVDKLEVSDDTTPPFEAGNNQGGLILRDIFVDGNSQGEGIKGTGWDITITDIIIDELEPDQTPFPPPIPPFELTGGRFQGDGIVVGPNNIITGRIFKLENVDGYIRNSEFPPGANGYCTVDIKDTSSFDFSGNTIEGHALGHALCVDPSFNVTIENNTIANASNCILIDNSNVTLINNNNISNCQVGVNITNASKHNVIRNNTIYNCSIGVGIYNGSWNNTVYYNNITAGTRTVIDYAQDFTGKGYNSFNTTVAGVPQGNRWGDLNKIRIYDSDLDGFGDAGMQYPYGLHSDGTVVGDIGGNVTDWGPMVDMHAVNYCARLNKSTVLTGDILTNIASGSCITFGATNIVLDCRGYRILQTTKTGTPRGIYINTANITVKNCEVYNFQDDIYSDSVNSFIYNNTVVNSTRYGIYVNSVQNVNISNNYLYNNSGAGMRLQGVSNNYIENNVVNKSGFTYAAITLTQTSPSNTLRNNIITAAGQSGIQLSLNSGHNLLINNTIYSNLRGLQISGDSNNITLINNTFTNNQFQDIYAGIGGNITFIDSNLIANYSFYTLDITVINNSAGELVFKQPIYEISSSNNFSNDIKVGSNSIFVNTTAASGLNVSANLTFYDISLSDPEPYYDLEDDGSFIACPENKCTEQSYVGTTYKYNVSSFTTFQAQDGTLACGQTLTSDTNLTADLLSNGTCFTIATNGIILDCAGYSITGNGTGTGVYLNSASNVIIRNCTVSNFSEGMYFYNGAHNNTAINNTVKNCTKALKAGETIQNAVYERNVLTNNLQDLVYIKQISALPAFRSSISLIDQPVANYSLAVGTGSQFLNLTVVNSGAGSLKFLTDFTIANGKNLYGNTTSDIQITNNRIFVNATNQPKFNISANLTFFGISFVDPDPIYDSEDDGTYATCPASICTEQSFGASTYKYNVSHFTTFSSQDVALVCNQTITSNTTLTQNLTFNGSCLAINASNVVLDCDGYAIIKNGTNSGTGVHILKNLSNVTVRNCTILNFNASGDMGIYDENGTNHNLLYNTLANSYIGIYSVSQASTIGYNVINDSILVGMQPAYNSSSGEYFIGVVTDNNVSFADGFPGSNGIYATTLGAINITQNNVFSNRRGIYLGFPTSQQHVWHNNMYNNSVTNFHVVSWPFEVSYNGQGNYWGRDSCPAVIAGTDTNNVQVTDAYPYTTKDAWLHGIQFTRCCGDTIRYSETLNTDLNCNGTGLTIATNGITYDCGGRSIRGNGTGTGIKISNANNVNITNCIVSGFVTDIDSDPAIGTIIENSIIENATTCILFNETNQSIIRNNSLWNCTTYAVRFIDSYLNNVSNNYIEYVRRGILLEETTASNRIINNTIYNYTSTTSTIPYAISIDGDNNTISNNSILNGSAPGFTRVVGIYVGYGEGGNTLANDNIFEGNTITNVTSRSSSSAGIYIRTGINSLIELNSISEVSGRGIAVEQNYTIIRNNTIYDSKGNGILLQQPDRGHIAVHNNTIYNIFGTNPSDSGIKITDSNKYHNISENIIYNCVAGMLLGDEYGSEDDLQFHKVWDNEVFSNTGTGIQLFLAQDVRIFNNTARNNGGNGIVLNTTDFCNVTNNSVYSNSAHGIMVDETAGGGGAGTGDWIENNRVTGNTMNGINVFQSSQVTIINNTATSNNHGIHVHSSGSSTVIYNAVNQNNVNGILINNSNHVKVLNNTADGNTFDGIGTYDVDNNTLEFNLAQNSGRGGIIIEYTDWSFIFNNTAILNLNNNGMELFRSHYNVMSGNIADSNGKDGIQLDEANNNNITFNVANSNQGSWAGPPPAGSGILLDDQSYYNLIHNNTLIANNAGGITIEGSDNNTITNNTLGSNNIGVNVTGTSTGNIFYFNNFTASKIVHAHAVTAGNSFNRTNAAKAPGFTAEGNAWDDIQQWKNFDSNADGFADTGAEYPYGLQMDGLTIYGNVTGDVTDWGPMNANASPIPPSTQQVILNSAYQTNFTEEDLRCYANITDDLSATITAYYKWYNNTVLVPGFSGSAVINNNTLTLISTIAPSATHIGESWTCEVFGGDGTTNETTPLNSTNLTVIGCGNLGRSMTLIEDRREGNSCLNLTSDDIFLDCANYVLDGFNITGTVAITAVMRNNVTVKNCEIINYSYGIKLNYTNNSFVFNNDVYNNSLDQIILYNSNLNDIYNNTANGKLFRRSAFSFGSSGRGSFTLIDSNYNRLYDNIHKKRSTAFPFGGRSNHTVYLFNSSFNNITNNTASDTNMEGFFMGQSSSFNRFVKNHANNSGMAGFHFFAGSNNNVLFNNTANNNGLDGFRFENSHNNTIRNNSAGPNDGLSGFYLILSNYNILENNFADVEGLNGINMDRSNFTRIENNVIGTYSGGNGLYDYSLLNSHHNVLKYNKGTRPSTANYELTGSTHNNFTNNTASSCYNDGIEIQAGSHNNLFVNNTINDTGWWGTWVYNSWGNQFINHKVIDSVWWGAWHGYELDNASNTVLIDCVADDGTGGDGFFLLNSSNVSITGCIARNYTRHGIHLLESDDVTITDCTSTINAVSDLNITDSIGVQFIDSFAQGYRFAQAGITFENTTHGKINFTALLNENNSNLMQDIQFANKYFFVNSSNAPGLNVSADLTFLTLLFVDPKPIVDFEDNGNFINCPATVCTEQSYVGTTYKYQVTHFTNYSAGEAVSNMTVVKADNIDPVNNGSVLTYTIAYNNNGEGNITNVVINETYDVNITFINSTPAPDDPTTNNTWVIGNLTVNQSGTVTINVFVNESMANNTNLTNFVNLTYQNSTGHNLSTTDTELTLVQLTPPPPAPPAAAPVLGGGGGGSRASYYAYRDATPEPEPRPVTPPTKTRRQAKPANVTVEEKAPEKVAALPVAAKPVEEKGFSGGFLWWLIPLLLLLVLLLVLYEVKLHKIKERVSTMPGAMKYKKPARELSTRTLAAGFFEKYGRKPEYKQLIAELKKKKLAKQKKVKIKKPKKVKKTKIKPKKLETKRSVKELATVFAAKYYKEKPKKLIKVKKIKPKKVKKVKPKKTKKLKIRTARKVKSFTKEGKDLASLESDMKDITGKIDKLLKKKL